jgi:bacterioferritin-associated ferredoxin
MKMKDWKIAGLEEVVCSCCNVTKGDVIDAIDAGAKTIEQVMEKTHMKCEEGLAQESRKNVQALLDTYLAAIKGMKCG